MQIWGLWLWPVSTFQRRCTPKRRHGSHCSLCSQRIHSTVFGPAWDFHCIDIITLSAKVCPCGNSDPCMPKALKNETSRSGCDGWREVDLSTDPSKQSHSLAYLHSCLWLSNIVVRHPRWCSNSAPQAKQIVHVHQWWRQSHVHAGDSPEGRCFDLFSSITRMTVKRIAQH